MRCIRPAIAGITLALLVPLLAAVPASAGAPPVPIDDARDWLVAQQEPDGGFELADFPGFETPDAILAIATAAQTASTWSTVEARAAVQAVDNGGTTALDWADDFVDAGTSAALEAKIALLVALPLGFNPAGFDPKGNGATDLTDSLGTLTPALFNSFLTAKILEPSVGLGANVHQDDVQSICEAQQASGGWSFDADPSGATAADADTSGFATMALAAAGVKLDDAVIEAAEGFFETTQQPDGSWLSFGSSDPNATTLAALGYTAAGEDPLTLANDANAFLEAQQITMAGPDFGRIASPSDGFGVNTFATSQTIQAFALLAGDPTWLPRPGGQNRECLPAHAFNDVAPGAWNDNALRWLARFNIATGFPNGGFQPNGPLNREQASMWFDAFFPEVTGAPNPFPDVGPGAWFETGADFVGDPAYPGGAIATGFPPAGEFRGTDPFSRGQAILWLYKAAGRPDVSLLPPHGFADGAPWMDDALTWAKFYGIVTGFGDNTFRPNDQINRGQGAFWLYNLAAGPDAWFGGIARPSTIVHTPPPM